MTRGPQDRRQTDDVDPRLRASFPWWAVAMVLALMVLNLAVFAPVRHYDFVQLDDPVQVSENQHVAGGLTWGAIGWAFTSAHAGYWMPLVWLSHMTDVQIYGMKAGPHHVTNLLLHVANTLLLFGLLWRLTGSVGRSGFVAALFAVHPLHVESVAWITERKDVLSTLFWMMAIWAYVWWVHKRGAARYVLVVLTFALGLMAKPMIVTLPLVLLLVDVWPLGRLSGVGLRPSTLGLGRPSSSDRPKPEAHPPKPRRERRHTRQGTRTKAQELRTRTGDQGPFDSRTSAALARGRPAGRDNLLALMVEKLPLFALALAGSIVAVLTQRAAGAVSDLQAAPFTLRVENALVSYVAYLGKMLWPAGLVPYYGFPQSIPAWQLAGAVLLLAAITLAVVRLAARCPYLLVGWFWYLVTLLPVIGLVQVGVQGMADRFTYVPLIGIFIMMAWGVPDLLARVRMPRREMMAAVAAVIVVVACAVSARAQVGYWRDSVSMWTRTTEVTMHTDAYHAHLALGSTLRLQGRLDEALSHFAEAARLQPRSAEAQYELGATYATQGRYEDAMSRLSQALRLKPDLAAAHLDLATVFARQQRLDEAIAHYRAALSIAPDAPDAHNNLGAALAQQGKLQEALPHFAEAVRLKPDFESARMNLGVALANTGRPQEALQQFQEAVRLDPRNDAARRAVEQLSTSGRR